MKALRVLGILVAALGALGFGASYAVEANYAARAQLVQLIQRDAGAELFGDAGTPIGAPQQLIIDDPKAFLESPQGGPRLVDDAYLKKADIYPLQLKTVRAVANYARLGSGGALVLGVGLALLASRRLRRHATLAATPAA